ncbi:MAG: glycosyltransferase family 39 protein, partial [bacterium]
SLFIKLEDFLNNGKNFYKSFFFLVVFLCAVKLPSLLTSDIQPWDEGMYAARVLSIHTYGDFIDQSSHSAGGFYSASHPPLLIWIGYFATLVFGVNSITLKLVIFIFSLLCVYLIMTLGKNLFSISAGFYAALIFCSDIIFTVFSQRFQFDIPYTFFILLSFYLFFLYNDTQDFKYIILSGISLGCCLMTKILVGFYIPMVLFISFFLIRDKVNFRLKDIFILTLTGVSIAAPWHVYMIAQYGSAFTDYFFKFHVYDRALQGVEMNEKSSGIFYHVNYLLSIIPYSVLAFVSCLEYLKNIKSLSWQKIFMLVWFITGLLILTFFKTKLEAYILMILVPGCFLIVQYIREINNVKVNIKSVTIFVTIFNIIWFATEHIRPGMKLYISQSNKIFSAVIIAGLALIFYFLSRFLADKIELKKTYYIFILIFFFAINFYYLVRIPPWVNGFKLSGVKDYIDRSGNKKIIYVGSNSRFNPQFSYYFIEPDLNKTNPEYEFKFEDTKEGYEVIKDKLSNPVNKNFFIIVEKDQISRSVYDSSELFIPAESRLILKDTGYELYEN